jgi:dihydrofolate reductase
MGKLVVGTFVTLDGVMQAPGGPDEDRDGGFELGGWSVNYWDDMMGQTVTAQTERGDALLLGRKTYDIFVAHWPRVGDEDPVAAKLNAMPKYVASRTLESSDWNNTTVLRGDAAESVRRLKEQVDGEIHVTGSSNLIQTLVRSDLVDEFVVWTFPLVVGSGKRLFGDGTVPGGLELVDSVTSTTGVTISTYRRAGQVEPGSFALDQ